MSTASVPPDFSYSTPDPKQRSEAGSPSPDPRLGSGPLEDRYGLHPDRAYFHSAPTYTHEYYRHRPRSPGLKWHKTYNAQSSRKGRIFMIDYVRQDYSHSGYRKVLAEEITDVDKLRKIYANSDRCDEAILRLFHIQNHAEALHFLLKKFNIKQSDSLVGTDFGNYVKYKRPKRRGGKPVLNARSWPTTHDPWRGISRTAFTLDYIKTYPVIHKTDGSDPKAVEDKMLEMNSYDENDNPKYGHDVYVQRLNCYVQHKETVTDVSLTPDVENPYDKPRREGEQSYVPDLNTLDNGNCIIIFENSESGSIDDTLITARQEWESRWRRLPFYLALESRDVSNDDRMALQCMKLILSDVWKSVTDNWENFIDICNSHVSILEDRIYELPADESRAPELWANAAFNLKIERLVALHTNVVRDVQSHLKDFVTEVSDDTWIEAAPSDMERVSNLVQEDLVKRLANLNDLLYKSVGIRDSRHSLTLNLSLWRLSWITFIFLPLTFMVGFFGMNVDTFSKDPSIKWYFIAAVALMICVIIGWYIFKHFLATQRQTPYSRGIYEGFFHELAVEYPSLWSRVGPRKAIRPKGFFNYIRWRLILFWNDSKKTIKAGPDEDSTYDDLGVWSRLKRQLTRRWTAHLRLTSDYESDEAGLPLQDYSSTEITELAQGAPHANGTAQDTDLPGGMLKVAMPAQLHAQILQGSDSTQRPGSQGSSAGRNSGVLVEEERPNWLRDYALKGRQSSKARRASFQQPFSPMHTEASPTAAVAVQDAGNAEGPGAEKPSES